MSKTRRTGNAFLDQIMDERRLKKSNFHISSCSVKLLAVINNAPSLT